MLSVQNAIISVYDKSGVVDFARALQKEFGVRIYSSGGTARVLREAQLDVTEISDYTGAVEILDGRVKTLHPKIHGGILAKRDKKEHMQTLKEQGIVRFDMVVCNLYPFEEVVSAGADLQKALENIDIGGPSMVRAAAKNHPFVAVVTSPVQYASVLEEMRQNGGALTEPTLRELAVEAFARTAAYDAAIHKYLASLNGAKWAKTLVMSYQLLGELRYGENPHQSAAVYRAARLEAGSLAAAEVLQTGGRGLSFNNYLDTDGALNCVRLFKKPTVAIIKHTVPCGLGQGGSLAEAFGKALAGDPVSAFGGIVAANKKIDTETARLIADKKNFFEVVVAPDYEPEALEILKTAAPWSGNLRILKIAQLSYPSEPEVRYVTGGLLLQDADSAPDAEGEWEVVTERKPDDTEWEQVRFAWLVCRYVKSNAVVLARDGMLVGAGGGQTSRVDAAKVAVMKAGERAVGAVAASDAFFPFPDGVEVLADAGVVGVVQPGGSKRDKEVIQAANARGLFMVFTHRRHFRH